MKSPADSAGTAQRPDRHLGIYRKIYSGFAQWPPLNRVAEFAELVYIRAHMIADDYGCFPGDSRTISCLAFPKRPTVTSQRVGKAMKELCNANLVRCYEVQGESLAMIADFVRMQPAGKNGRRVSRFPLPEDFEMPADAVVNPGESKGIQNNPGESGSTMPMPITHAQEQEHTHPQAHSHATTFKTNGNGVGGLGGRLGSLSEMGLGGGSDAASNRGVVEKIKIRNLLVEEGVIKRNADYFVNALRANVSLAQVQEIIDDVKASGGVESVPAVIMSRLQSVNDAEVY